MNVACLVHMTSNTRIHFRVCISLSVICGWGKRSFQGQLINVSMHHNGTYDQLWNTLWVQREFCGEIIRSWMKRRHLRWIFKRKKKRSLEMDDSLINARARLRDFPFISKIANFVCPTKWVRVTCPTCLIRIIHIPQDVAFIIFLPEDHSKCSQFRLHLSEEHKTCCP